MIVSPKPITDIKEQIYSSGLITIIRGKFSLANIMAISEALVAGGVNIVEVTLNTTNALEGIKEIKKNFGDDVLVGAGTVRTAEDVKKAVEADSEFIITPCLDMDVVEAAQEHNKLVFPGIFTATEAQQAYLLGCETVKLFPADALGPKYMKALRAPLDHIDFIPTGGVNPDTIKNFHDAGAVAFGIGSYLVNNAIVQDGEISQSELTALTERTKLLQQKMEEARS